MITRLNISNFKSIKELELECARVNLFIGEPNVGKSNILESLSLISNTHYKSLVDFVRLDTPANLFYDDVLTDPVKISIDLDPPLTEQRLHFTLEHKDDRFIGYDGDKETMRLDYDAFDIMGNISGTFAFIKYYKYKEQLTFPNRNSSFLNPPNGDNLFAVIMGNKVIKKHISDLFQNFGLSISLKAKERTIEAMKHVDNVFYSYPYITLSDTLKRMIFYTTAMESNENSTLVFEEPESNSFPFYTKELAEWIGRDKRDNQFFITTHNPYFLETIIEKTPRKHLAIFHVYYTDYHTEAKLLKQEDLSEMLDEDPFFILKRFIK